MEEDYDYKIKCWIGDAIYLWIGHKNIDKCSRIYLVPFRFTSNKKYYDVYFYEKTYSLRTGFFNFEKVLYENRSSDTLYLFNRKCSYSKIFDSFFKVKDPYDITNLIKKYTSHTFKQEGYYCELRRTFQENDKIISKKFNLNPHKINKIFDLDFVVNFSEDENYNFQLEKKISDLPNRYQNLKFYDMSQDFFENTRGVFKKITSFEYIGRRKEMEDTSLFCDFGKGVYMIAILDGHADNRKASQHFSRDIPKKINDMIKNNINEEIIKQAFLLSDENFYTINQYKGGTCFSGVLITPQDIFVINLGDSRTSIINNKKIIFVTKDHSPILELKRIINSLKNNKIKPSIIKYFVEYCKTNNRLMNVPDENDNVGTLAISRSLGDNDYKYNYAKEIECGNECKEIYNKEWLGENGYLSSLPDVKKFSRDYLKDQTTIDIIIHCDGINEPYSMKNEHSVLNLYLKNKNNKNVSKIICEEAYKKGSEDNLSMITIEL